MIFKKKKTGQESPVTTEQAPETMEVKRPSDTIDICDLRRYLCDEFDRNEALEVKVKSLNAALESEKKHHCDTRDKYNVANLALGHGKERVYNLEADLKRMVCDRDRERRLKECAEDNYNRLRIELSRIDKGAVRQEAIDEMRKACIRKIEATKGNLSKAHAIEIIESAEC